MLIERGARLASHPDAIKPYIRRGERFARCFVYYAATDGSIHRSSNVVFIDFRSQFIQTYNGRIWRLTLHPPENS
jgi:hypothetical protein